MYIPRKRGDFFSLVAGWFDFTRNEHLCSQKVCDIELPCYQTEGIFTKREMAAISMFEIVLQ